jgi:hypothetical protein
MPENVVALLKALFDSNESYIVINGHTSPAFPISSGMLQGSLLSPLLYSVFIDDLIVSLNNAQVPSGVLISGRAYRCLLYADDIVLMSNTWSSLKAMLQIVENHSNANRYRFSVPKCEIVASADPHVYGDMCLYGQKLPVSKVFTYLGCAFNADGVDWPSHQMKMATRALAAAGALKDAGINGRVLSMTTSLSAFRTFIRPVLEYGLAICRKTKLDTVHKEYKRCLSWLSSSGKGACLATTELFGGLEPFAARHEKLDRRFFLRAQTLAKDKQRHFAVVDALQSAKSKKTRGSTFNTMEVLNSVQAYLRAWNDRHWLAAEESGAPDWKERLEEFVAGTCASYHSAFIFGGRDTLEKKLLLKEYSKLNSKEQRMIYLWCLNRASGVWKTCRHCHLQAATKAHLELCALGIYTCHTGPSNLEDRLHDAVSLAELQEIAADIYACIGDGPIDG